MQPKKSDHVLLRHTNLLAVVSGLTLAACASAGDIETAAKQSIVSSAKTNALAPAARFDLSHWKLTLPVDDDGDGKADSIRVDPLQSYSHPDFFYLDDQGHMVFTSPNQGGKTSNSSNTRSELRYMIRGSNRKFKTAGPLNNFTLASNPNADEFAAIGGRMLATLHIDHVPLNANRPDDGSAYAGVIGQIHGVRLKEAGDGFGNGTEPLKIVYKKWPEHETGSVYWHYERNQPRGHPNKKDIIYPVWGKDRKDDTDPGEGGIALGEDFSYIVNVYKDTMYLTFVSPRLGRVTQQLNLADNVDLYGNIDAKDHPQGYANDAHYFKAGIYNQCRATAKGRETEGRCQGTGNWDIDKSNGDYFQVSFSRLSVTQSIPQ